MHMAIYYYRDCGVKLVERLTVVLASHSSLWKAFESSYFESFPEDENTSQLLHDVNDAWPACETTSA